MTTIGYKRVEGAVLELEILGSAQPTGEHNGYQGWRTSHVRVLRAYPLTGREPAEEYRSLREPSLVYRVGAVVSSRGWDELGHEGIYYLETRAAARRY